MKIDSNKALHIFFILFWIGFILFRINKDHQRHRNEERKRERYSIEQNKWKEREEEIKIYESMVENNRQEEKNRITGNMRDRDHNCYKTVIIGNQEWMAENMRATRDRNGNPIELSKKESIDTPYRYFPHDSQIQRHGYLYNWEAAMKVCPQGWHLPTDEDWEQLEKYVGSQKKYVCDKYNNKTNIAKALADTIGWYGTNNYYERSFTFGTIGDYLKANNATGFSARSVPQESMVDYDTASFWSATDERNDNRVIARVLRYDIATLWSVPMSKDDKASVRCIRDNCQ